MKSTLSVIRVIIGSTLMINEKKRKNEVAKGNRMLNVRLFCQGEDTIYSHLWSRHLVKGL